MLGKAQVTALIAMFGVLFLMPLGGTAQTVTGSGTTNTVPAFTGTSTIGNSPISVSGGNVGIGTTTPGAPLTVQGLGLGHFGPAVADFSGFTASDRGGRRSAIPALDPLRVLQSIFTDITQPLNHWLRRSRWEPIWA